MTNKTKKENILLNHPIGWTEETLNLVTGCREVSPACENCYARGTHKRNGGMELGRLNKAIQIGRTNDDLINIVSSFKYQNDWHDVRIHPHLLRIPYTWKKSRVVFVCSMSDFMNKDVPTWFILLAIEMMRENRKHIFQILTKRAWRLIEIDELLHKAGKDWPDNVWVGITMEDNDPKRISMLQSLISITAKVKWLSIEPMLGPVDLTGFIQYLDWVVVGGESVPSDKTLKDIRKMDLVHASKIMSICYKNNVPFFFKQSGTLQPCTQHIHPEDIDPQYYEHQYHMDLPPLDKDEHCKGNKGCKYLFGKLYQQFPKQFHEIRENLSIKEPVIDEKQKNCKHPPNQIQCTDCDDTMKDCNCFSCLAAICSNCGFWFNYGCNELVVDEEKMTTSEPIKMK